MAAPPLLDRRLAVVTGKGGVGKSTVAAALALLAARRGKRVLVCEVNAQERIAPLLGARPGGARIREVLPRVHTVNVTPQEALREYGLKVVRFQTIYDAVFENRVVRHFLGIVPGFGELVMLGKILHEARATEAGRPRWDLVVMDAPATGHAVQLLRVPQALLDAFPPGPLRQDAEWMRALLLDPARTGIALVTLPEEIPVNETIELDAEIRSVLGMPRAALLVNAMPPARFDAEEAARLGGMGGAPAPLGPAALAAAMAASRRARADHALARLREAVPLPGAVLPLVPVPRWDREAVEALADPLAAAGGTWL
ncbi:MAG TPA: ArsA-related P-loop ATPase [Anaeromyxobacteraceae bacterium]|nr:ArsA-related P-loop ATPase [Anaeromyxobacteraceae bacterium]